MAQEVKPSSTKQKVSSFVPLGLESACQSVLGQETDSQLLPSHWVCTSQYIPNSQSQAQINWGWLHQGGHPV